LKAKRIVLFKRAAFLGCALFAIGIASFTLRQPPHLLSISTRICEPYDWEIDRGPDSQLGFVSGSRLPGFLLRFLPSLKHPPNREMSIWISGIDGRGMREIGRLPTPERQPVSAYLENLRWLPDGRTLSFFYERPGPNGKWQSTLYTVPVDKI
jgi:hypothetical protein